MEAKYLQPHSYILTVINQNFKLLSAPLHTLTQLARLLGAGGSFTARTPALFQDQDLSGKRSKSYDNGSIFPLSVCAILKFSKIKPNFKKNGVILKHQPISTSSRTWTVSLYSGENRPESTGAASPPGAIRAPRPPSTCAAGHAPDLWPPGPPSAPRTRHPLAPPAALPRLPAARCRRCPGPRSRTPAPVPAARPRPPAAGRTPSLPAPSAPRAPSKQPTCAAGRTPRPEPASGADPVRAPGPPARSPPAPRAAAAARSHVCRGAPEMRFCSRGARADLRPGAGPARGATAATANGRWRAGRAAPGARRAGPAFFEALGFPRNHFARRRRRAVVLSSSAVRSGGPGSVRRNSRGPRGRPPGQVKVRAGGGYRMAEVKPVRTEAGSQLAEVRAVGGWREGVRWRGRGRSGGQIEPVKARVAGVQRSVLQTASGPPEPPPWPGYLSKCGRSVWGCVGGSPPS